MSEDKNIEQSQEDRKTEILQETNNESQVVNRETLNVNEAINPTSDVNTSEIENMEIHHHPDLHHKEKKFKEYFLEFLMIFLAVTLGFFAESYREYVADRSKEKEYMFSMLIDLKQDTTQMSEALYENGTIIKGLDTLMNILSVPRKDAEFAKSLYAYSLVYGFSYQPVNFSDVTLAQLKNNSGLRTIENKTVSDKIMQYDVAKELCIENFEGLDKYFHLVEATQKDIFDFSLVKPIYDSMAYMRWTTFLHNNVLGLVKKNVYLKNTDHNLL